jgi:hypothetical protein
MVPKHLMMTRLLWVLIPGLWLFFQVVLVQSMLSFPSLDSTPTWNV